MNYWKLDDHTIYQTLNFVFDQLHKEISISQIYRFSKLIEDSIEKIIVTGFSNKIKFVAHSKKGRIVDFLNYCNDFICCKIETRIRGPTSLNIDFYLSNDGYFKNSPFLFGTPSQFRRR